MWKHHTLLSAVGPASRLRTSLFVSKFRMERASRNLGAAPRAERLGARRGCSADAWDSLYHAWRLGDANLASIEEADGSVTITLRRNLNNRFHATVHPEPSSSARVEQQRTAREKPRAPTAAPEPPPKRRRRKRRRGPSALQAQALRRDVFVARKRAEQAQQELIVRQRAARRHLLRLASAKMLKVYRWRRMQSVWTDWRRSTTEAPEQIDRMEEDRGPKRAHESPLMTMPSASEISRAPAKKARDHDAPCDDDDDGDGSLLLGESLAG